MTASAEGPIGIVGMGSGGQAMAADLISRGCDVRVLVEADTAKAAALDSRPIALSGLLGSRDVAIPRVSTDPSGLAECRLIMVVTTADAHAAVARAIAPIVTPQHTVILNTGYVGGSVLFARALRAAGGRAPVVCETNTLVYSAYSPVPGRVHIQGVKRWVELAGPDTAATSRTATALISVYPQLIVGTSVFANGLNNPNPIIHVPILLLHFGLAETERAGDAGILARGSFFHLGELVTPAVAGLQAALEEERIAVMRAVGLGTAVIPRDDFVARCYGPGSKESVAPRLGSPFQERFWREDVPCGLVPIEALARSVEIAVPVTSSVITIVERLVGRDLRSGGRRFLAAEVGAFSESRPADERANH